MKAIRFHRFLFLSPNKYKLTGRNCFSAICNIPSVIFLYLAYTYFMKKLLLIIAVVLATSFTFLPACELKNAGPLKSLTRPYIAQYECTEATLGNEDLLDKFEYIKITLKNKEELELSYKPKDGEAKTLTSRYDFDSDTRTLTAEIGILGYTVKQSTVIENGKFTVTKPFGGKQLIMKFKAS